MVVCDDCNLQYQTTLGDEATTKTHCQPCANLRKKEFPIHISPLERSDLELVLAWRSNPDVYRYFSQQDGPLDWNEHVTWFESRDPERHDFVIHFDGRRVGVVSIDSTDEVTVYLGEITARGEGIATIALNWLCERFEDRTPLFAEIHEDNEASRRLFERCGFQLNEENSGWLWYAYEP